MDKIKFETLEKEKINPDIYYYLNKLLKKVYVEVVNKYEGNFFDLMLQGGLEGWCWQTTETAALFMPDDTIVYRGDLHLKNDCSTYYHSFISFVYDNVEYIFDPCLCLFNTKELYFKVLDVEIKGMTTSKDIKEYFINYINECYNTDKHITSTYNVSKEGWSFMKKFFGDDYEPSITNEVSVQGSNDVNSPMYRCGVGYKNIDIKNNKVRSLTAHYYYG